MANVPSANTPGVLYDRVICLAGGNRPNEIEVMLGRADEETLDSLLFTQEAFDSLFIHMRAWP